MITAQKASNEFGIPLTTLYRYIRKGRIKALKNPCGHGTLIYEEELPKLREIARVYKAKRERRER